MGSWPTNLVTKLVSSAAAREKKEHITVFEGHVYFYHYLFLVERASPIGCHLISSGSDRCEFSVKWESTVEQMNAVMKLLLLKVGKLGRPASDLPIFESRPAVLRVPSPSNRRPTPPVICSKIRKYAGGRQAPHYRPLTAYSAACVRVCVCAYLHASSQLNCSVHSSCWEMGWRRLVAEQATHQWERLPGWEIART